MPRAPFQVLIIPFRKTKNQGFEYAIFKRSDESYWQGIAGGGEEDESPLNAARREALEEADIPESAKYFRLKAVCYVPVYHFAARDTWPKDLYVIPNYCFAVESSGIEITLSSEHSEYRWVDYETGKSLLHWDDNRTALWELNERLLNDDLPPPC
jgi:dihydroneopterin triphosphate diphosphatase